MSMSLAGAEFSDEDFQKLKEINDALEPVHVLTKQICSESANLLTADVAMLTTLKWLKSQSGKISQDLHKKIIER